MEVILKQDIPNLGYSGDIIKVKPGYARNYLLPKGIAIIATESNQKIVKENQKQAAHKLAKIKAEAEAKADALKKLDLKFPVKVGTTGKIFGSITNLQISRYLKDHGYEVDRKDIAFTEEINKLGKYLFKVKIHKEVTAELTLNVVREEDLDGQE
jgi:large subunit ribosomal protein L9